MRIKAIYNTHKTVVSTNGDYQAFDSHGNLVTLNESLIQEEVTRLRAEYEHNEYQRLRAAEYPTIQEQMDMQYWDSVNGTTTWQDAINAVKAKYPKPEGV